MNYKMIGRFLAQILAVEGVFMIPAAVISFVNGEIQAFQAFLWTLLAISAAVIVLYLFSRGTKSRFYAKEGLVCVGISWIVLGLLGCLPFFLSGEIPGYLDALFEIVSGFTTTIL